MKLSLETLARTYAAGRNYISAAITLGGSIGIFSVAQQKSLTDGFSDVYAGIALIVHGGASISQVLIVVGAPLGVWYVARIASKSATGTSNAAAMGGSPATEVTPTPDGGALIKVKDPAMASAAIAADKKAA